MHKHSQSTNKKLENRTGKYFNRENVSQNVSTIFQTEVHRVIYVIAQPASKSVPSATYYSQRSRSPEPDEKRATSEKRLGRVVKEKAPSYPSI